MKYFDMYITLIFVVKVAFILLALTHLHYRTKGELDSKNDKNVVYWKERCEFVFIVLMSLLLIYVFNPRQPKLYLINNETKILLYLFGFILILTAKWEVFFKESKLLKDVQKVAGDEK
jgi:hypothetical protein